MPDDEIPVRTITLRLCDACLDGEGGECHTPGCALFLNRAPDLPLRSPAVTVHAESGMVNDDRLSAALEEIREREKAASEGPWRIIWDSCDCGDGYGCSHGSWPYAIRTSRPDIDRGPGKEPRDYDYEHSEVADLGTADVEFIVAARRDVPRLLAALDKVLDLADEWADGSYSSSSALDEDRAWVRAACGATLRKAITCGLLGEENGG